MPISGIRGIGSRSSFGGGRKQITFVGSVGGSSAGSTSTTLSISLTSIPMQAGDLVIVAHAEGGTTNRTMSLGSTGYTKLVDLYSDLTSGSLADTNLAVYYKFMTATPDTSVVLPVNASTSDSRSAVVQVWRNVNPSNPIDVAATSTTGTGTLIPTFGSKTLSTTENSKVILVSAGATATAAAYTAGPTATDAQTFLSVAGADTYDSVVGITSYSPFVGESRGFANFLIGTDQASSSNATVNLTLQASL